VTVPDHTRVAPVVRGGVPAVTGVGAMAGVEGTTDGAGVTVPDHTRVAPVVRGGVPAVTGVGAMAGVEAAPFDHTTVLVGVVLIAD
jgi:hypothetical protein